MHLLNWDEICKPKSEGGLGLKKFSLMNQAMVAKQFWRISHNSHSLIARALKAKYFPRCSIHDCTPKPHHSWIWRGIVNQRNPKLKESRWWIGKGFDIPLTHQAWYPCSTQNLNNTNLQSKTVADLINHSNGTWKPDLVRAIYPYPISEEIMSNPISKTGTVADKLLWKYSNSGVFKVRDTYKLIQEDTSSSCSNHHSYNSIPTNIWKLIWKVKLPLKIGNFIWKLMHDSLLTLLTLKNRGIQTPSTCPLCNSDEESTSHRFLYCSFARATWHGTTLAIQTSELRNIFCVQIWIGNLLLSYKGMDSVSMRYLQDMFTTLWTMWRHRNSVVHEGIQPNPIEVILTAQHLSCRYQTNLSKAQQPPQQRVHHNSGHPYVEREWQILIKIAGTKRKMAKRCAYAYEARNLQGNIILQVLLVVLLKLPRVQLRKH